VSVLFLAFLLLLTLHFHQSLLLLASPDVAFSPAVPVFLSADDVESLLWPPILASLMLVDVS
jgi:hypothetical protein